jgi:hypothetical protein
VPGKHVSNSGHCLVCSVRCGTILLKPHIGTVYSSSAQFWVLPIQKMSGSRGSRCIFPEYNQQDVMFHNLFNSVRRSTCFGWFFRPSSGAMLLPAASQVISR